MSSALDKVPPAAAKGIELYRTGDVEGAVEAFRGILQDDPGNSDVTSSLGVALRALGRRDEGLAVLKEGVDNNPDHQELNFNYGNALRDAGDFDAALLHYQKVAAVNPDNIAVAMNLGLCLERTQKLQEAVNHYGRVLKRHPDQAEIYHNLGVSLWLQKHLEAAIAAYRRAIALKPDYPQALFNLGVALDAAGQYEAGEAAFRSALHYQPEMTDALSGLGQNLISQGRLEEATSWFDEALASDSELLDAHLGRVRGNLLSGNLVDGWAEFGWHRKRANWQASKVTGSTWHGEDITGKSILLYGEQGLGDVIHFSRYTNLVAGRGAQVHLYCPQSLARLLETLDGVETVTSDDQTVPESDHVASLMDLPGIFGTTLQTIDNLCPYLRSPAGRTRQRRPGHPFRVGLVWAGNEIHQRDRDRSCPLERFVPLFSVPGTEFYSLQMGAPAGEIAQMGLAGMMTNVGKDLTDFAHTADVLTQLDLLITVDTAIAHLAGALDLPVWTLLAYAPDWRWMLDRSDTPWYPSMTLYRQPVPGDWSGVFSQVEGDLRILASAPVPT